MSFLVTCTIFLDFSQPFTKDISYFFVTSKVFIVRFFFLLLHLFDHSIKFLVFPLQSLFLSFTDKVGYCSVPLCLFLNDGAEYCIVGEILVDSSVVGW